MLVSRRLLDILCFTRSDNQFEIMLGFVEDSYFDELSLGKLLSFHGR